MSNQPLGGTEKTPALEEGDTQFLNEIFTYSSDAVTRLSMAGFKALWAERFFANPEEDKTAVLTDWEFNVALSRTVPVYLTDENKQPRWIFPPIVGELSPGQTANTRSLDFLNKEIKMIRDRFVVQGIEAEKKVLAAVQPKASNRAMLDLHMFMIRRECGYLTAEEEAMVNQVLTGVKAPVLGSAEDSTDSNEEEYDYD